MDPRMIPDVHPDPRLNLMRDYVAETARALASGGLRVERSWLDPTCPRDATILYSSGGADATLRALVWDEEAGWRTGAFVSGAPRVRTELTGAMYLGGGVLVAPGEVAGRLYDDVREARTMYRSMWDVRDGLDDALRSY